MMMRMQLLQDVQNRVSLQTVPLSVSDNPADDTNSVDADSLFILSCALSDCGSAVMWNAKDSLGGGNVLNCDTACD